MASYPPPETNISIFNPLDYISEDSSLSIITGDERYIKRSNGSAITRITFPLGLTSTESLLLGSNLGIEENSSKVSIFTSDTARLDVGSKLSSYVPIECIDGSTSAVSHSFRSSSNSGMNYYETAPDELRTVDLLLEGEEYLSIVNNTDTNKYVEIGNGKELRLDDGSQIGFYRDLLSDDLNSRIFCDGVANLTLSSLRGSAAITLNAASALYFFISSSLKFRIESSSIRMDEGLFIYESTGHINLYDTGNSNKQYTIETDNNNLLIVEQTLGYPIECIGGATSGSFQGQVAFTPGSEARPGLTFRTSRSSTPYVLSNIDSDTGICRLNANNIGISCGGIATINTQQSNTSIISSEFIHKPLTNLTTTTDFRIQVGDGISAYTDIVHIDETAANYDVPITLPNTSGGSGSLSHYSTLTLADQIWQSSGGGDFFTNSDSSSLSFTRVGAMVCMNCTLASGTTSGVGFATLSSVITARYRPATEIEFTFIYKEGISTIKQGICTITTGGTLELRTDSGSLFSGSTSIELRGFSMSWNV